MLPRHAHNPFARAAAVVLHPGSGRALAFNPLGKALLHTKISDAQCGFKAITKQAAARLLPLVADDGWLMDTELLVIAERLGYRIFDLPVRWTEDTDSRVKVGRDAVAAVKGLMRIRENLAWGKYGEPESARLSGLFTASEVSSRRHAAYRSP